MNTVGQRIRNKMDEEIIKKYKEAGEIAKKVRLFSKDVVKPGVKYLDVCSKIEDKIIALGGEIAFPTNVSINEIAAHETARVNDDREIKKEELVKIDFGVHKEGYIADTALSFCWDDKHKDLIKASEEALKAAEDTIKFGVELRKVGKAIEDAIKNFGYNSIKNLSEHGLEHYDLHSGLTIPNFDNSSNAILEEEMAIAIEPFATSGSGFVIEGRESDIFSLEGNASLRSPNSRKLFNFIAEEREILPFAKRQLLRKFSLFEVSSGFVELKKFLKNYPNLKEETNEPVSQTENTLLVLKSGNIKTT